MRAFLFFVLQFCFTSLAIGQGAVDFVLIDQVSGEQVVDAHVFCVNSTHGAYSDSEGRVRLTMPKDFSGDVIISHIGYEIKSVLAEELSDSVYLRPSRLELGEVTVRAAKKKIRKRDLKRFRRYFLGDDRTAKKCQILNPEVLDFEKDGRGMVVTADRPLLIRNDHLGYELTYYLTRFELAKDGSSSYKGRALFKDIGGDEEYAKRRRKAYKYSLRDFIETIIATPHDHAYTIKAVRHEQNQLKPFLTLEADEIVKLDTSTGQYYLIFPEFLMVTHPALSKTVEIDGSSMMSGEEKSKFGDSAARGNSRVTRIPSYIYKVKPKLRVDRHGHILDTEYLREYGHWAEQRVAMMLPYDYNLPEEELELPSFDIKGAIYDLVNGNNIESAKKNIDKNWQEGYTPILIELLRLVQDGNLISWIRNILEDKTGQSYRASYYDWMSWLWTKDPTYTDEYVELKGELYSSIDPKFQRYFDQAKDRADIRIDEIMWGGVKQDGIPPLRYPSLLGVDSAEYLSDADVVYGVFINGQARAYPKRIIAWHELFWDRLGDMEITGVYCTLCGTVIIYQSEVDGVRHELGTSGFLYRSNKLMYDVATQSLWNTLEGKPVVGPLFDQGIELLSVPVVTTSWGAWRDAHPETTVLDIATGHQRNYDEGEAYKEYYSHDRLMFPVADRSNALKNKAEVFVTPSSADPVAISVDFLKEKRFITYEQNNQSIVAVMDKGGAIRTYNVKGVRFDNYDGDILLDRDGRSWRITEDALVTDDGSRLNRVSGHRVFWFAWYAQHPDTRLVD